MRAEEERGARHQQAARCEALAHVERQRRRHQPLEPGPDTIYRLEMGSGRTGSGRQRGLERLGGEHSGQFSGGVRIEGGQTEQSSAAAEGRRSQRGGKQESRSQQSGHTGSATHGRGAGQVEGGKGEHSGHGTQGKGAGQEGLQGKGHGQAGLHGVGSKGHGAAGRKGKGQGKEGGHGYMGLPVFPGKGFDSGHARQATVKCGRARQEGDKVATGRRQGGDRKTTGKRQESDRKAAGKRQEVTGRRQEGDRRAATGGRQEGNRAATGWRQEDDRDATGNKT